MPITLYSSPMKYKDPTTGNYVDLVGISGNPGSGIASVVLNNDYTLTINFTDNTSTTTTSIRGAQGATGTTFTPSVSSAGVISWTNDGGATNPSSVDLVAAVIAALPTAVGVEF